MADTVVSPKLRVQQWDDKHHLSYVRSNRFKPFMGTNENAIIQLKEDLTKKPGDRITIPLVGALDATSGPNTGATPLVGNEKALPNDGHMLTVGLVRDAVSVRVMEEQVSPIDIRNAARVSLKDLQMRYLRNDIIRALGSVGGVAYGTATAAQRNAWNVTNTDRVLFGDARSHFNATHATALNAVTGSMTLKRDTVSLMKRIAQTAKTANGDGIRPYKLDGDEETFVLFVNSMAFRDLRKDIGTDWQQAMERSKSNPLFTGPNSILWDGVMVREIPEILGLDNTAATPVRLAPIYLCGAQALGVAWAQRTKTTERKEDDYGIVKGVGFQEIRGVDKLRYGDSGADWSMVTGFVAAANDA